MNSCVTLQGVVGTVTIYKLHTACCSPKISCAGVPARKKEGSHILSGPLRKPAAETSASTPRDIGNAPEDGFLGRLKCCMSGGRIIYCICQTLIILGCGVYVTAVESQTELSSLLR